MDNLNFYNISYLVTKDEITLIKNGKNFSIKKNNKKIYDFFIDLDDGINFKILFFKDNNSYEELLNYKINIKVSKIDIEQDEEGIIRKISIHSNTLNYIINIDEYNYVIEISKFKVLKNLAKIYNCFDMGLCIL